jgi:hypothetical protein
VTDAIAVTRPLLEPKGTGTNDLSPRCTDPGYTRAQLMNVVHAYRHAVDDGRRTLMAVDQGNYWASYDRCDGDGR